MMRSQDLHARLFPWIHREGKEMAIDFVTIQAPIQSRINPAVECLLRNGIECMMAGDHSEAIRLFDKIIDTEPYNASAYLNKGNVLDLLGNYSDALKCYNSAIECDPFNAEAWYSRGITLKKTGALDEGLQDIRKGISLAMGEI